MNTDRDSIATTDWADDGKYPHQEVTREIIGAAYEGSWRVGMGVPGEGLRERPGDRTRQAGIAGQGAGGDSSAQKGEPAGRYYADLLINDAVLCEIKAVETLDNAHQAQLLHYLKATGIKVGLLINFGPRRVQVKRMVF